MIESDRWAAPDAAGHEEDSVMELGFATTTGDVTAGVDLTGKVALVTGASSGLGRETARARPGPA